MNPVTGICSNLSAWGDRCVARRRNVSHPSTLVFSKHPAGPSSTEPLTNVSDSMQLQVRHRPERVVHVVGQMTDAVFNFLGPTTAALAAGGCRQLLLTHEDTRSSCWLPRLDPAVEIVLVPASRNPLVRWLRLSSRLRSLVAGEAPATVHLHGLMPSLAGAPFVSRLARMGTQVYLSPHSSKSLRSLGWLGRPLFRLLSAALARHSHNAIANVPFDVRALSRLSATPVSLIESPVADAFFYTRRSRLARSPLVIGSSLSEGHDGMANFAQLAVLLSDQNLGLSFNWITPAAAHDLGPLEAATVGIFPEPDDESRAGRLAAAWIYVMAGPSRGFPLPLAEAMAVGLPCVALDLEAHRDMIRHGETGLLCADTPALMRAVAQLIASPEMREQLGSAARKDALCRFRSDDFHRRVFEAYSQLGATSERRAPAPVAQQVVQP